MINADGEHVDLYIPRKCSWTNRIMTATDKASVQLNVGHLDANGVYSGQYTTLALSGYVRQKVRYASELHDANWVCLSSRASDKLGASGASARGLVPAGSID